MTPKPRIDVERIERIIGDAYHSESYEAISPRRGVWDVSQDCEKPVPVSSWSRATGRIDRAIYGKSPPLAEITLLTACRRCRTCLRKKARLWSTRAKRECAVAERTWFCTLTTSPDIDFQVDMACAGRVAEFWGLPPEKKFQHQSLEMGKEVTKFLKRVLKNSGCSYRYLLIVETHDSKETSPEKRGRPHMHALIHEFPGMPIRKVKLESAWRWGFATFKLVESDQRASWYVSKYISKAMDCRTRASIGYGNQSYSE